RIDKAHIKNTDQRLTQPGYVSIVYAHQQEAKEYEKYIQYLESINYLVKGSTEYFELEEMPGAQGLRAIRVKVNLKSEPKQFGGQILNDIFDVVNV
ncbi:MAG: GAF domain-containing protein, partial [Bacteroidota bacterium]